MNVIFNQFCLRMVFHCDLIFPRIENRYDLLKILIKVNKTKHSLKTTDTEHVELLI